MKAVKKPIAVDFEFASEDGSINTLEGKMSYKKGDAIITGVQGERYACRRDIFDQTYDIAADNPKKSVKKIYLAYQLIHHNDGKTVCNHIKGFANYDDLMEMAKAYGLLKYEELEVEGI